MKVDLFNCNLIFNLEETFQLLKIGQRHPVRGHQTKGANGTLHIRPRLARQLNEWFALRAT